MANICGAPNKQEVDNCCDANIIKIEVAKKENKFLGQFCDYDGSEAASTLSAADFLAMGESKEIV